MLIDQILELDNFISSIEIADIKTRVYKLENYYKNINVPTSNIKKIASCTLGNSLYTCNRKIDTDMNAIMNAEFSDLYQKTLEFLKLKLQIENIFISSITPPGFHIFRGLERSAQVTHLEDYHRDITIFGYYPAADPESIVSFSCLIENTKDPAYLDTGDKNHYYTYGCLTLWNGLMLHRIGRTEYNNDTRITFQGHIFKDVATGNYFIHF